MFLGFCDILGHKHDKALSDTVTALRAHLESGNKTCGLEVLISHGVGHIHYHKHMPHLHRNKTTDTFKVEQNTTILKSFSNVFYQIEMFFFWLKFHQFAPRSAIDNKSALVQVKARH